MRNTKFSKFLNAICNDWLARMSGPLTVPVTIAALFVSTTAYKGLFATLAVLAAMVTCYRVWVKEFDRAEAEIGKNQHPDIRGSVLIAFSVQGESLVGRPISKDTRLIVFLKLVNHRDVPTTIDRYELRIRVGETERTIVGEAIFDAFKVKHSSDYKDSLTTSDGMYHHTSVYPIGLRITTVAPLRRGIATGGYVLFYLVNAVSTERCSYEDLAITVTDAFGGSHPIPALKTKVIHGLAEDAT